MELEISKQSTDLAVRARGLRVVDQESLTLANELLLAGKGLIKLIKDKFTLAKKAQDEAKRKLLDWERAELMGVESVVAFLAREIINYRVEQDRIRREAEEKARRQEEERRRLAEKALREAEEKERLAREAEARAAREKDGEARKKAQEEAARRQAEADKILAKAAAEEKKFEVAVVVPEKAITTGTAICHNWKFRVTSLGAVPLEYHLINDVMVGRIVRSSEGKVRIPGIEIYDEPYTRKT